MARHLKYQLVYKQERKVSAVIKTSGWTIGEWQQAYRSGAYTPRDLLEPLHSELTTSDPAWISLIDTEQLTAELARVQSLGNASTLPLYGIPFAVKDNIDVAGLSTTAACPEFAYLADEDAFVVARLRALGAIVLGKTNLDQFATGLVGTRSPYGAVPNTFQSDYISGGSSSGSASVVARGLVPFALGTDTAGSGRVPAGFNNLVGWKPTRGAFSTRGVVPACKSLDCVSLFTQSVIESQLLAEWLTQFDARDPYSRKAPASCRTTFGNKPRFAYPTQMAWFGDAEQQQAFEASCQQLGAMGAELTAIDFTPMYELARLLYEGPWVAERHAELEGFMAEHQEQMDPVVAAIVDSARHHTATTAFRAEYRRMALTRQIQAVFDEYDALLVPTTPRFPTGKEIAAEPVSINSQLGTYTNFVNLADCCALALPAGFRRDGLPFGLTLIAPAWHDHALANWGQSWQAFSQLPLGATGRHLALHAQAQSGKANDEQIIAVVGAHLSGMPLNHELTSRGATLLERSRTAGYYRLYAIANSQPPKPALVASQEQGGAAIELELWSLPKWAWADFMAGIPSPLGLGTITLADGRQVKGFICEPAALTGAKEITEFGGWRAYIRSLTAPRVCL